MDIYNEIQKYIHHLSSNDYQLIEQMQTKYSDTQILNLIKEHPGKPIAYISKIQPRVIDKPEWLDKDIDYEPMTIEELEPLMEEWKEFFNNEEEYQIWCERQKENIRNEK